MNWLGWFKNDLKDLEGQEGIDKKEIDSIVKEYGGKKSPLDGLKKKLSEQNKKRAEKKKDKGSLGETTSDDIANQRRKKLFAYTWKFLIITFVFIILTALYKVMSTGIPQQTKKVDAKKVLEGIEVEDDDYAAARTRAQINALAAELKKIKEAGSKKEQATQQALLEEAKKNKMLEKKLREMQTKLQSKEKNATDATLSALVEEKIEALKKQLAALTQRPSPAVVSHGISPLPSSGKDIGSEVLTEAPKKETSLPPEVKKEVEKRVGSAVKAMRDEYEYSNVTITSLPDDSEVDGLLEKDVPKEKEPSLHIMTGFAKAILITGLDAPTYESGKANPVPVILSLNSYEIIANGFDADIEDCMLIGQGFGNMATSRAEIEITRISCNIKRNGVLYKIEEHVKGWVYDENGIHGVDGRLVDSSGKIITKEIAVGFLQGVATAFAQPQTTINTGTGIALQQFTTDNLKDAAGRGLGQGTASALTGLSEYYQKLLDGLYPFVSVRSGREVTVLFKGGEDIKMVPYKRVDVTSDEEELQDDDMEIRIDEW